MTRQLHDQFAKQYLEELLSPLGKVETSKDISSEIRQVDVWFVPQSTLDQSQPKLGILNQIAVTSCLIEPFRNAPTEVEIRTCLLKLYQLHGNELRKARREKNAIAEAELPHLWMLVPSFSSRMIQGFGGAVKKEWGTGIYFLAEFLKAAVIAINQLPETQETLWLRVLGRGGTQKRAVEALLKIPENNPFRENLLDVLANWRKNLELRENITEEDREIIMNLSPAYLQQREEWRQEGLQQGLRSLIESLLEGHFGSLDVDVSSLAEAIAQLPHPKRTQLLLNLPNLSREELLQQLQKETNPEN